MSSSLSVVDAVLKFAEPSPRSGPHDGLASALAAAWVGGEELPVGGKAAAVMAPRFLGRGSLS